MSSFFSRSRPHTIFLLLLQKTPTNHFPTAQALSWLLTVPGASNTVLEARVPYGGVRSWASALGNSADPSVPPSSPRSLASAQAAAALAAAAYRQAAQLSPFPSPSSFPSSAEILGVGCSCALATGRQRAGSDRVFVAAHGSKGVFSASAELPRVEPQELLQSPSSSSFHRREAQDALASRLLLRTVGAAVGCEALASLSIRGGGGDGEAREEGGERLGAEIEIEERFEAREDPISALLAGRASSVELGGGLPAVVDAPRGPGRVYLSGSFNPLHAGHEGLLRAAVAAAEAEAEATAEAAACDRGAGETPATTTTGNGGNGDSPYPSTTTLPVEGAFELSVVNADKGTLSEEEVRRRVEQFSKSSSSSDSNSNFRVVLTRAPLFEQKAALFGRGASFAVGVDTAVRLLDPKYYRGGSDAGLGLSMGRIAARGARVFVAGRKVKRKSDKSGGEGEQEEEAFLTLSSSGALDSSPAAKVVASLGLFREIPEESFREDVSSTELRERAKREAAAAVAREEEKD